ncbi:hypothetical protein BK816_02805 [Boudabousia tangfeifanii]|uniref:Major facilitator superfamily (MFS) profile domain-containing protein n=1 Tax=Boudabousia tangfeifanii TaxID=1912795 RepID=A0A1D9MJJ8_9ACTO|nr:MFS transporter [Boudabousia tangfeifanii]AOZ72363.1 hypothetical protein BK816_02805 [Boudabousia tangfeifanii]
MSPQSKPAVQRLPIGALVSLSLASFAVITSELFPAGLINVMKNDLQVSESAVGYLMSVYAFTVVITCIPLTIVTKNVERTKLLRLVVLGFAIGCLGTALVPNYSSVLVMRMVTALAHGMFWSLLSAYPAYLVPPRLVPRAVTFTSVGGSAAFILGVPFSTWLGQQLGWRGAMISLSVFMIVVWAVMLKLLPAVGIGSDHHDTSEENAAQLTEGGAATVDDLAPQGKTKRRLAPVSKGAAIGLCVTVALYVTGHYTAYTYIALIITRQLGFSPSLLSLMLLISGILGFFGSLTSGRLYEKYTVRALLAALFLASSCLLGLFFLGQGAKWAGLAVFLLWSCVAAFVPPFFVMRLLSVTPAQIRDTFSAIYNASFNAGIGSGSALGGFLLTRLALPSVIGIAGVIVMSAFVVSFFMTRITSSQTSAAR